MTGLYVQYKLTEQWPASLTRELCCALRDQRCQHHHKHIEVSHLALPFSYGRTLYSYAHSGESIRSTYTQLKQDIQPLLARARQPQIYMAILATRQEQNVMEKLQGSSLKFIGVWMVVIYASHLFLLQKLGFLPY